MAKRVNVNRRYMLQREKSTSAGAKGTFMGKWSPKKSTKSNSSIIKQAVSKTHSQYKKTFKWLGEND